MMKSFQASFPWLAWFLILGVLHAAENMPAQPTNPLLKLSSLPFGYPAFDQIKDEHYAPALEQGMAEQLKEVAAIAEDPNQATFANTLEALERSGQLLTQVGSVFFNMCGANTNAVLEEAELAMAPKLAAHKDAIRLNARLFARIDDLYQRREKLGLDAEAKRVLERYYKDYVRFGAKLSEKDKTRLKELNTELATLSTTFTQNVLKEKNASSITIDTREELDGLSEGEIVAAAEAAKADGKPDKFVLRLVNTTRQPALTSLKNRAVRERLHQASLARGGSGGAFDNREVVARLVRLRAERAVLLGFKNHAEYQLEEQTAGNVATVNKFLADLAKPAVAMARREAADMQVLVDQEKGGFQLGAADWEFYAEKVQTARYAFDESQLKPFFELNRVFIDGVFYAATQLYGITFKERHDLPVYHPDVRVFEVSNADGSPLALFLLDSFARPSKRGGAWMNEYISQSNLLGMKPVVGNHLNIPKPQAGEPALMTLDDVVTAFHEFGHALHGMFSNVRYPRFCGTTVPGDFVEFPSQINEMWVLWPQVLKNYAKHYKTGEPMSAALVEKVLAAQKFNQGFTTTEYLAAALLDQVWHQVTVAETPPADRVVEFEAAALKKVGLDYALVPPRYRSTYFSHIFTDDAYSAGYYSYIWSEVLDADCEQWFKDHGGLTRENGDRLRKAVLSRGGSDEAMVLYRELVGRDPRVEPLLERRGLNLPAK